MGIKSDYLRVLKIINDNNDNKPDITTKELYQKIQNLTDEGFQMWTRGSFYSVINTLKAKEYITKEKIKKIPTETKIKITKKAQDMLKIFEKNGKDEKIKKPVEITYPKYKGLEDDELAELAQEVGYKIISCMGKGFEELTEKESERVRKSAPEIVKYVIKQIT